MNTARVRSRAGKAPSPDADSVTPKALSAKAVSLFYCLRRLDSTCPADNTRGLAWGYCWKTLE
jgi:hypothetical protein